MLLPPLIRRPLARASLIVAIIATVLPLGMETASALTTGALSLNGTSQYVTMGASPGLRSSTFTVELWFKVNSGNKGVLFGEQNGDLSDFAGRVSDSGEGRWTIAAAVDESVPTPVLSAALFQRFSSRGEGDFANKILSALRYQFGGHQEKGA
jgi:hypothetical protein